LGLSIEESDDVNHKQVESPELPRALTAWPLGGRKWGLSLNYRYRRR
jgi:hypothetical protein